MPDRKPCRSTSPDGVPCARQRGHKAFLHTCLGKVWRDGINVPASWVREDDDHMSEGDFQSWGRIGW